MSDPAPAMPLPYLSAYPGEVQEKVRQMIMQGRLDEALRRKYPAGHAVRSDTALYDYVLELKNRFLRNAPPLSKVAFDNLLHVRNALGTHSSVSRIQGSNLRAKREIRVAALFKDAPAEFLKMIVVHELAHLKEGAHDKAFYQLCAHMEPDYFQLEFDLRLYLTLLDRAGRCPRR
jgi:UTP pyrophosphatase